MVDLAGVDEVGPLAAADVKAVPLRPVQSEAGDGQRLALRAVFFTQSLLRPVG
jgi:hypothetical protein